MKLFILFSVPVSILFLTSCDRPAPIPPAPPTPMSAEAQTASAERVLTIPDSGTRVIAITQTDELLEFDSVEGKNATVLVVDTSSQQRTKPIRLRIGRITGRVLWIQRGKDGANGERGKEGARGNDGAAGEDAVVKQQAPPFVLSRQELFSQMRLLSKQIVCVRPPTNGGPASAGSDGLVGGRGENGGPAPDLDVAVSVFDGEITFRSEGGAGGRGGSGGGGGQGGRAGLAGKRDPLGICPPALPGQDGAPGKTGADGPDGEPGRAGTIHWTSAMIFFTDENSFSIARTHSFSWRNQSMVGGLGPGREPSGGLETSREFFSEKALRSS